MSATATELAKRVLQRLQVLDSTETPSSEDEQLVEDAYTDLHETLSAEGLVTWDVTDSIPTGAVIPMTAVLAAEVAQEFGIGSTDLNALIMRAEIGRLELRRLGKGTIESRTVKGEYY
jgi:hypothetical protein